MRREVHWFTFLLGAPAIASCVAVVGREAPAVPAVPERVLAEASPRSTVARPAHSGTAVLVSAGVPEYDAIVTEILRRQAQVSVHVLPAQPDEATGAIAEVVRERPARIIAVGLPAAVAAREVRATPTVFCAVYNYADHHLLSPTTKGVSLLPPFALQLRAWRRLAPNLRRVGVITGPEEGALLAEMRRATSSAAVELTARVARSDLEAVYEVRQIAPQVDGLWLLPDNRILSPDAVRKILSYSAQHGKQVAAFGDSLLAMGALLSLTAEPRDVVDRVFERLAAVDHDGRLPEPDVMPLTVVRLRVNDQVAARFGLTAFERATDAR